MGIAAVLASLAVTGCGGEGAIEEAEAMVATSIPKAAPGAQGAEIPSRVGSETAPAEVVEEEGTLAPGWPPPSPKAPSPSPVPVPIESPTTGGTAL
ncbi:hypothetical protein [Chondromyces crocatus]|uniref:Uncharacterized protein n=1 Tax=Chondromyces crocatus TaxID=52 RepID=A0A0K1EIE1_CHOCO|nr:hypothetical protein [Chondromyces crocatus]AKT40363.1 uncharacterized protein CMC5_045160 [Chondromyces crocatus]